jgi:hypothetical protein
MTGTIVGQQHNGRIGFGAPILAEPADLLEANSRRHRRNEARAATERLLARSPEIYDRFVVPLFFETYAHDLAVRLTKAAPQKVLETAAGTGGPYQGNGSEASRASAYCRNRSQPGDARSWCRKARVS